VRILWFLVAVHFISELTKLDFIVTIVEHNYVYLNQACTTHGPHAASESFSFGPRELSQLPKMLQKLNLEYR